MEIELETLKARSENQKLKSEMLFINQKIHNLKSPITALMLRTSMLAENNSDNIQKEKIIQLAQSINLSVCEILNLKNRNVIEEINISKVLRDEVLNLKEIFEPKGVIVNFLIEDCPSILGKQEDIAQVFQNLFCNSLHAMHGVSLKIIAVECCYKNGKIFCSVTDSGCGIDQENISKIFSPYFTTKSQSKNEHENGNGLGLAFVKSVVENHFGQISVHSEKNVYTTFEIEFFVR